MLAKIALWMVPWLIIAGLPASGSFKLDSYGFGTGGTANSSSGNYRINGIAGDAASGTESSSNYKVKAGETHQKEANVPTITISNDDRWYNKLKVVIGPQNNPSDAKFAVAISTDNFASDVRYVKSDFTVGTTLGFSDYLTYAAWGSASGQMVRGLSRSTVYTVKAKAYQGKFTESGYGPTSSAATVDPQLSFDIDVSSLDQSTSPPYLISFGTIPVSTVTDSPKKVWASIDTNGESGAKVYVSGANGGLRSAGASYTIASSSVDLSSQAEGFGAQGTSATQSSEGPLALVSPYDGSSANVGVVDSVIRQIFTSPGPVISGRGSFLLKAKTKPLTPSSADYTEILTVIAAGSF
jgi:hypothetical protein